MLDRVPAGAADEIGPHLPRCCATTHLGGAPLFVLPEAHARRPGPAGRAGHHAAARLVRRAGQLGVGARAAVVRQTLGGALDALGPAVDGLAAAADDQVAAAGRLADAVRAAYRGAEHAVEDGMRDGVLLRGEVLARWQEFVGTGDLMRALQARVGRARDRIVAAVTGRPAPGKQLQAALESGWSR